MQDRAFKTIVIGAPGSGKSCLLTRYTKNQFIQGYNTTLGVEFASKVTKLDGNTQVKLQIWDTAGQQSFKSIIKSFYRNVSAVFLVYNIASRRSFDQLEFWYSQAAENCNQDVIFVLIGAQKDREDERQVPKEVAEEFMIRMKISFMFETSAKTSENVELAFQETAKQIFIKKIGTQLSSANTLKTSKKKKKDKDGCC